MDNELSDSYDSEPKAFVELSGHKSTYPTRDKISDQDESQEEGMSPRFRAPERPVGLNLSSKNQ